MGSLKMKKIPNLIKIFEIYFWVIGNILEMDGHVVFLFFYFLIPLLTPITHMF